MFWPQEGGGAQVLKICRSEDGGKSWTAPAPIPSSASRSARGVYPGSLSVLASGRIVLQFAPYYELGEHQHGDPAQLTVSAGIGAGEVYRVPEYCCSDDGTRSSHTTYSHNLSLKRMPLLSQTGTASARCGRSHTITSPTTASSASLW